MEELASSALLIGLDRDATRKLEGRLVQTSLDRVARCLDRGTAALVRCDDLAEAVDDLRQDVLQEARRGHRTPTLLRALERDSTSSRDGDAFQNRAITLVRSIERDLKSLIEREGVIKRLFGRGFSDEFRATLERIAALRESLVANRKAGARAASTYCLVLAREAEALLRGGSGLADERFTYSGAATLVHGLVFLSVIDHDSSAEGEASLWLVQDAPDSARS